MTEGGEARPVSVDTNALLKALQRPRVMLILLAAWDIIGALAEFFSSSGIFADLHGEEINGALGGRALSWEAIPLAALYIYAARDPARFPFVFWIALIEQAAAIAANIYHWGAGDFSIESIIIPIIVAAGLLVLVFLHLFGPKERAVAQEPSAPQAPE
ncbi:MAG: hypothetical protein HYS09_08560 [Chloroflexi bacterium]|nr:hypothetical protein [Chloroflexota bacterium]